MYENLEVHSSYFTGLFEKIICVIKFENLILFMFFQNYSEKN